MKRIWVYLLGTTFYSAGALANPVADAMVRVRQVPNTMHVQVTYVTMSAANAGSITSATRDGLPLVGEWAAIGSYATNLGSGVHDVPGYQRCDCDVSAGIHVYGVSTEDSWGTRTLTANVTITTNYAGPGTPASGGSTGVGGMMPWDEPEPTEMQGLDCAANCQTVTPGAGGAGGTGGTSAVVSTAGGTSAVVSTAGGTNAIVSTAGGTSATQASSDESGCSVIERRTSRSAITWLVLIGAIQLFRRRR